MRGVLRGRPSIAEPRGGDLGTMYAGGECGRGQADTSPGRPHRLVREIESGKVPVMPL
jgi:hypothetical protein